MDFSFLKTDIKSCLRVWSKNIKWIFISLLLHRLSHLHLSVSRNTTSKLVLNIKHLWYFYQIFIGLNIHFEYKINSWSIFGNFIERDTCYLIYSCTDKSFIYSNTPCTYGIIVVYGAPSSQMLVHSVDLWQLFS